MSHYFYFSKLENLGFKKKNENSFDETSNRIWNLIEAGDSCNDDLKSFLFYLDANNLVRFIWLNIYKVRLALIMLFQYGAAQTLKMPKCNFNWCSSKETEFLNKFYLMKSSNPKFSKHEISKYEVFEENTGFFLQCDLEVCM